VGRQGRDIVSRPALAGRPAADTFFFKSLSTRVDKQKVVGFAELVEDVLAKPSDRVLLDGHVGFEPQVAEHFAKFVRVLPLVLGRLPAADKEVVSRQVV